MRRATRCMNCHDTGSRKGGLDPDTVLAVLGESTGASTMLKAYGRKFFAADHAPGFMVDLQQKDLRLVLDAAYAHKVPVPGTGLTHELYTALQAAGRTVPIVGVNAIPGAIAALQAGTLLATVDFDAMKMACVAIAVRGVFSDGFHTIAFPHTRARAEFQLHTATGKLKALITPTTPNGCHCSCRRC